METHGRHISAPRSSWPANRDHHFVNQTGNYVKNGNTGWILGWKKNGWKNAAKKAW